MDITKFHIFIKYTTLLIILGGCSKGGIIDDIINDTDKEFKSKIIAHRGAWMNNYLEQNSLNAINIANTLDIWGCEIDIRETKDEQLILCHDAFISNLQIKDHTYTEIKEAASKEGRLIAALNEVLETLKHSNVNIVVEVKEANVSRLKELIDSYPSVKHRLSYMSFSKDICRSLIKNNLRPTYLLIEKGSINYTELIQERYTGIAIDRDLLRKNLNIFDKCKKNNLMILVWTVNNYPQITEYINRGADFIITDIPHNL